MADYDFNLVFEGGGAKGIVLVGAMQEFEAQGFTYGRLLGTSAGAITATLLAAGFTADGLFKAINEKLPNGNSRFSTFMDVPATFDSQDIKTSLTQLILETIDLPFVPEHIESRLDERIIGSLMNYPVYRQIFSFVERGGLYAGQSFVDWLTEKLEEKKPGLGSATLAEFNRYTEKDLTVVASDTMAGKFLVLNHRTAPDCPVVMAVRMSMSIPFVWQEVRWQADWGYYQYQDITGHTIVDGGVLSNFPIELLISRDDEILNLMGPSDGVFALGMLIDEDMPVPGAEPEISIEQADEMLFELAIDIKSLAITQRVTRLLNTMWLGHDKQVIDAYKNGVCRLPAGGYQTTDFNMSADRTQFLIKAGQTSMRDFLKELLPYLQEHHPNKLRKLHLT